ncbi:MAG TPA: sulfotransferase [Gammaproteobacteria bacterium]|jgi:hypothetical protein
MLPTFVCIGGQKTGTTWLYHKLIPHPDVFLPATKELNFFYRDLPRPWYEQQFEGARPGQARGDISPNYMALPGVAERMSELLPEARIICMLREPVSRARSQYGMATQLGNIPADTPFIEAFRHNLQFIKERGRYTELISRFSRYYPLGEQLLVLLYDDLLADPHGFFRAICRHIGVDEDYAPADLADRVRASEGGFQLSREDEAEARAYYSSHVTALEGLLGRSLDTWRN